MTVEMGQTVEISLRIPSLRVKNEGTGVAETITNSDVRFSTQMDLPSVPKPGAILEMTAGSAAPFECEVVRSDWRDDKNMFVVAVRYGKRSVSPDTYRAISNSADWSTTSLL